MRVGTCVRRAATALVAVSMLSLWSGPSGPSVASAAFSCSSGGATYEVRSGDGWYAIAERADVSARELLDANGASLDDVVVPGDRLCLPGGANLLGLCRSTTTVRDGEGWGSIAARSGVSVSSVLTANGASLDRVLHPDETICLPAGASGASSAPTAGDSSASAGADYTVERGDSWYGIAERAGTTVRALLDVNDASASGPLYPGDGIVLPAGSTTPSSRGSSGSAESSGSGWVNLDALPTQGPCWYSDSWGHGRTGGRRHVGTDIFTFGGSYVYAVADGRLTLRKWAQPGNISGNAWRLTADDGNAYFYAHLSDFAPEVSAGSRVEAGQIIGWVGATGNTTVDHLHFEIRPGGGGPVNPYPILRAQGGACNEGTPYTQPSGWVPD
ncbi:MAG: hypothetical protein CL424_04495 [Acidimicrobiaceae bacterium]|nr:hypothetical protein [Acidimicrobiaceae bacterium]